MIRWMILDLEQIDHGAPRDIAQASVGVRIARDLVGERRIAVRVMSTAPPRLNAAPR